MWAYRIDGPGFVRRAELPDTSAAPGPGQVRLRLRVGALCGSDMPRLNCVITRPQQKIDYAAAPVHEIVAEVLDSASDLLHVGQRVVGTGGGDLGLCEFFLGSDQSYIPVPEGLTDVEAVTIQSLSTVLRASTQFPEVAGRRVAVIGAGPIGLCFCHVLRHRGAAGVTMIDPVEREEESRHFGADQFVRSRSAQWAGSLDDAHRPDVVVEAVGHQGGTIGDAVRAVAQRGFVYGFGSPDEPNYVLPYQQLYEKNATLAAGRTLGDWRAVLRAGEAYLLEHRSDFKSYVSHVVSVDDAQRAYSLYARPRLGRLKVAVVADDVDR